MRVFPVFILCACSSASGDAAPDNNVVTDSGTKPDTNIVATDTSTPETGFAPDVSGVDTDTTFPVRKIPGLKSITYYERSGGTEPTAYTFTVDGPEMTAKLAALSDASKDIKGVDSEFYDVYYSNAMGDFELDGRYLTISGVFNYALPAGGGLNLAEIVLNYDAGMKEFGNYVASFEAYGDNAAPGTVNNCIDGKLDTHTTMGNTVGTTKRLRITLGFKSSSGPPK